MSDNARQLLRLRAWLADVTDRPYNWGRSYDHLVFLSECRLRETAAHLIGFMAGASE